MATKTKTTKTKSANGDGAAISDGSPISALRAAHDATEIATSTGTAKKPAKKVEVERGQITLPRLDIRLLNLHIVGDAPLICHKWSEKAKREMLDKQMKKAKPAKVAKDPQKDYEESLYRGPNGEYQFPAIAFKCAAIDACSHVDGITKVEARGAFHVMGEYVDIIGKPTKREDMVRVGMGTADIRFRGEFKKWSTRFVVRYNARVLSPEQITNLFNTAGFAIGVGEWRPEKNGDKGLFHVE
jgi:hypothetical protein